MFCLVVSRVFPRAGRHAQRTGVDGFTLKRGTVATAIESAHSLGASMRGAFAAVRSGFATNSKAATVTRFANSPVAAVCQTRGFLA